MLHCELKYSVRLMDYGRLASARGLEPTDVHRRQADPVLAPPSHHPRHVVDICSLDLVMTADEEFFPSSPLFIHPAFQRFSIHFIIFIAQKMKPRAYPISRRRDMSQQLPNHRRAPKPQIMRTFNNTMQSMLTNLHLKHRASFSVLPPEVVEKIFEFLSTPDLICFGLSCRYNLCRLKAYFEEQKIQLHQLLPIEKRKTIYTEIKQQPRLQFLLRLESAHWRYCRDCQVLHPDSTWQALRDFKDTRRKRTKCCSRCSFQSGSLLCMPYAGEVEICPCTRITFVDKLHLIQLCKKEKRLVRLDKKKSLSHPSSRKLQNDLQHFCVFNGNPLFKVKIQTDILYDDDGWELYLYNSYRIYTTGEFPSKSLRSLMACPHKDIDGLARQIFHDGGSSFTGWDKARSPRSVKYCGWTKYENAGRCYYSLTINTERNLGGTKWPDKAWSRQSS
ncbi:F-box protein [Aspergillus niger CBS 101883]|uniref:F-box protein n=1 Tax=Aspergillus lacticoffeatus (strain CBS 101883) TaxID=1450533 RepID=UPI000D7F4BAA|nr:uncharacterized protein BO96DRAFT_490278 [Aspergillus niger CBS 101883]PYH50713.1 hypothetical protein BO96DRAFT_490278 [Aspergillus niger CBS 101883]